MSNLSLSRKVEKALTLYMQSVITSGLNIYEGHEKAEIVEQPYLVCFAEDAVPHPDMPPSVGVRVVSMRFELRVDSESTNARQLLDGWRMTTEDSLSDVSAISNFTQALNFDWEGYIPYVYDSLPNNEPTEFDKADWVEQFVVNIVCQLTAEPQTFVAVSGTITPNMNGNYYSQGRDSNGYKRYTLSNAAYSSTVSRIERVGAHWYIWKYTAGTFNGYWRSTSSPPSTSPVSASSWVPNTTETGTPTIIAVSL